MKNFIGKYQQQEQENQVFLGKKLEIQVLNSSYKCNGIHINNLFKFFVWCEVSKSFTRSII